MYPLRHSSADVQETTAAKIKRIRTLQQFAGATPCFATDIRFSCRDQNCLWRAECLRPIAAWLR